MIKAIQAKYSDAVLHAAAARYGIAAGQAKRIGAFESFVYEYTRDGQGYILKINHTIRRSEEYLMGEIEWVNFLADRGVPVARAVPSKYGRLVERIPAEAGGAWLVTAYEKAPGHRVAASEWNGDLFAAWGRLTGTMHRLTRSFKPSNPAYKRQEWYEEEQLKARKYLPAGEAAVIARADELFSYLRGLPTPENAYGLLHTDLHHGNFFVEKGQITAFDFDDSHYNWFAGDIAVSLIGALWFPPKPYEDEVAHACDFLRSFLRGYYEENRLDPTWLRHIPDFMMLRDLLQFIIVYQSLDVATFNEDQRARLDEHRRRILERRPPVDLDWMQFAASPDA